MVRSLVGALVALSLACCKPNAAPGVCGTTDPSEEPVCADSAAPAKASGAPSAKPSAAPR